MAWASAALFVAPLMTGLPSVLRLQFSVSAMVMMLVSLWLIARPRLTLNGQREHRAISPKLTGSLATPP